MQEVLVCLAIYGGRGDADFQVIAVYTGDFIPAGAGLNPD